MNVSFQPGPVRGLSAMDGQELLLTRVQRRLRSSFGARSFLYDVADLAVDLVASPVSCAVTLEEHGKPITAAASDERASRAEQLQIRHDSGPCLAAMRTGSAVDVPDIDQDRRWEAFASDVSAEGVRSVASTPLVLNDMALGALNLYGGRVEAFAAVDDDALGSLAYEAAYAYDTLARQARLEATNQQLMDALASRPVIDQAIGIIMGQSSCAASEAFSMLRQHSQNNNMKLRDLASQLVARTSGQESEEAPDFTVDGVPVHSAGGRDQATGVVIEPLATSPGLRLAGEADAAMQQRLRNSLAELFARPATHEDLVLDVSGLGFADVSCLRLLVQAADLAHQRGARVVLHEPSAQLLRVLELTWGPVETLHFGTGGQP